MSATIEREQAVGELAHFIRQQAGEQNSITALAEAIPQIVWTARPDGWVEFCNQRCLEYLGMALEQIRGWDWQSVIHPADVPVSLERWRHALTSGDVFEIEYRIRGADGVYRWFLGRALPVRDAGGRIVKWFGTCTDIDTQKRAEGRIVELNGLLQRRVAELQTLLDVLPVGIAIAEDRDCNRLRFNRHFIETWGLAGGTNYSPNVPSNERPGRYKLRRGGVEVPDEDLPMKVAAANGVGVADDELELVLDDGRIFHLCVDAAPLFDEGGKPRGCVAAIQDVTERKRAQHELRKASDAAEATSRAKDQFLAMLSHELRTPLTPVLLTASALERDPETPPHLRSEFEAIRRNVELEARLIDDLMDVSRAIQGKMSYHFEATDLHLLVCRTLETCQDELFSERHRLVLDLSATGHHVECDPARLQQVLWNLVKNAVKFTPEGGTITIRSRDQSGGRVVIEVSDTGIGIAEDTLPTIFNAFEQGGDSVTRHFGGLSLGLAISRPIVEAHGGSLTAASDGVGRGTTFRIDLATGAARVSHDESPGPESIPMRTGLRVLLADDDAATVDVMADSLRRKGHEVTTATSLTGALEAASAAFDVVVSDIELGDGSGHDLMRHVKDRYGIPGIALSGYAAEEDIQESRRAGFIAHLAKPVTCSALEATVQQVTSVTAVSNSNPPGERGTK